MLVKVILSELLSCKDGAGINNAKELYNKGSQKDS